jgi:hypothetical protein
VVGGTLSNKLTGSATAIVNEFPGQLDNFGFCSVTTDTFSADSFSKSDGSHYITSPYAGGSISLLTSFMTMPKPSGTLAPDLQVVAEFATAEFGLVALDTGATRHDGNPAPARRAHLPFAPAETTQLTADGETILQRTLEWAAGEGAGAGGGGGGGSGTTVTLNPTQDTFVGGNSTSVYAENVSLFMGFGSREWRPVLQFDVSGIPAGSTVTSAKLRLHNWDDGSTNAGPLTVTAYGVEQAWTEKWGNKGANWYDRVKQGGGALQWSTPGVSYSTGDSAIATFDSTAAPQWVEWQVAPLVQGWIDGASTNNGVVLVPDAGSAFANSRSADYGDSALHPQLVVTYE